MKAGLLLIALLTASPSPCTLADRTLVIAQNDDAGTIESFIARQARRERGEEYRDARKILEGDLDHDGLPDKVMLYTIESQGGSNNYVQYVAVFVRRNGRLKPLTYTAVGGKSMRSVELASVGDNKINLDMLTYGAKDPSCCPTIKGTTHYALVGRTLRERNATRTEKQIGKRNKRR